MIAKDVVEHIYENTLTVRAKTAWQREKDCSKNDLAWIFFVKDKNSFDKGTSIRTYNTLAKKAEHSFERLDVSVNDAPFITFNSFGIRKKLKTCLRWINAVSIELDNSKSKEGEISLPDVMYFCQLFHLSYPSLVIKSPNGIHLHWLIEKEPAFKNKIADYDFISEALKKVFSNIGADAVGVERYWRMPTSYNLLYEHGDKYTLKELKEWAKDILYTEENHKYAPLYKRKTISTTRVFQNNFLGNPAIRELLNGVPYGYGIRNKTAFNLALGLYTIENMNEREIFTFLSKEWNPKNEKALSQSELRKTVKSACSGRYKGIKASYINEILETLDSKNRYKYRIFSVYKGQKKYKKKSEMVERILQFIKSNGGDLCISQRKLASELGAAFKSVQLAIEEIKKSNLAQIITKPGCRGGTHFILPTKENQRVSREVTASEKNDTANSNKNRTQDEKVIPIGFKNPLRRIKSIISTLAKQRITMNDLYKLSGIKSYKEFYHHMNNLFNQKVIEIDHFERDGTVIIRVVNLHRLE